MPLRYRIGAPVRPTTISLAMKSVKLSSMSAVNRHWGEEGEKAADHRSGGPRYQVWQRRFFDRALRTVKEYNEKVEYIHLNPVKAGLVSRPEDGRWSSYNEYAGMSAEEQKRRCGLIVDRVRIPTDPRANLIALSRDGKDADHKTGGPRYSLSDRIAIRPEVAGQLLIDNDHRGSVFIVAIVEAASAYERDLHGLEVAGRDGEVARSDEGFTRLHGVPLGCNHAVVVVVDVPVDPSGGRVAFPSHIIGGRIQR